MKQVCIIHGGSTFDSDQDYLENLKNMEVKYERMLYGRRWQNWLGEQLDDEYELVLPQMPSASNAKYDEWALFFEKVVHFLKPNTTLVGHSLGGIFLVKFLNEHPEYHFEKIVLIAAPYNGTSSETLGSFSLPATIDRFISATDHQAIFHSRDDKVVPFTEAAKYTAVLPNSELYSFDTHGHFNVEALPELLAFIKK
jgi:predicted alpha/beta hydrolase family esterase